MTNTQRGLLVGVFFSMLFLVLALAGRLHPVWAQTADLPVISNEAVVDFPNTAAFRLEVGPEVSLADAVLTYYLGVDSCIDAGTRVSVDSVENNIAQWTWVMSRSGNPPPGAGLSWEWTVTDSAGNSYTTPRKSLTFQDERFDWQTVSAENIRLHWYRGSDVGPTLLNAAVAGLAQLEGDIGIELDDEIQIFIYGSSADMREALLFVQDWAGGVAFSEYNIILIGVEPSVVDTYGKPTVRHELAHLVIGRFGQSCLGGSRPNWLNEGLAVYSEGEPDNSVLTDLELAIDNNTFFPVRSLNGSFPSHDSGVNLAYSQSYSLVNFLLESYGSDKMRELLLTLAQGEGYDAALEQVYGFNTDGLETAWRQSIGAPPRQIPPTPTPILAAAIPTYMPLNGVQSVPTQGPPGAATATPSTTSETTDQPTAVPEETAIPAEPSPESGSDDSISVCGVGLMPLIGFVFLSRRKRRQDGS